MERKNSSSFDEFYIDRESFISRNNIRGKREEDYDKHNIKWQKAKRFAEDTKHRRGLVLWVKYVVSFWLFGVLSVVSLNSLLHFELSENVLIALLTTTTVNILGLAYIVLKGLFKLENRD